MTNVEDPNAAFQLRKPPTQARAKITVEAILDAAARILVENGYAAANTNKIAEVAGVGVGSVYEYFPSKEAIFAELRRRESKAAYARLTAKPHPETPRAMLRHLVRTHVETYRNNRDLLVALESEVPRFAITDTEQSILEDFVPLSNAFLEANREVLRPANDAAFLTEFLMRVFSSTVLDYAKFSPHRLETTELEDAIIEMLGGFLLAD